MMCRNPSLLAFGLAIGAVGLGAPEAMQAQQAQQARTGGEWVMPRTPDGKPDLQGNWSNATTTPFTRPRDATSLYMPAEELERIFARIEATASRPAQAQVLDPNRTAPPVGGDGSTGAAGGVGGYNSVYIDRGDRPTIIDGQGRTSTVVDPPDGQVPPTIPRPAAAAAAGGGANRARFGQYDHPELRPLGERCIVSFGTNAGPPMLPNGFYNNNYTIVQTPDHVAIMTEMIHDTRIIRIGDGPRLPEDVRPWFGDSWGRWEGDTLVIETTNFHPLQRYRGASENLKIVERITRMDQDNLFYRFTVIDPTVWEREWSAELAFESLGNERLYEYACHEGNYALHNVLSGARYQEQRDAAAAQPDSR